MFEELVDYRERAAYCRTMSEDASTEGLKASWLELAQKWLDMAHIYRQSEAKVPALQRVS